MNENQFEAKYDITKKSRLREFYDSKKKLIFFLVFVLLFLIGSTTYYFENKKNKKIILSEKYVLAKIYLESNEKNKAADLLKENFYANDSTYSTLSFFLILNQKLITDEKIILDMFDHLLGNNRFDKEFRNLLTYKKALFSSNFVSEEILLKDLNDLLKGQSLWKAHSLLLLGDYFFSKNEFIKAKEFYLKILSTKDLQQDFYDLAKSQINLIGNE